MNGSLLEKSVFLWIYFQIPLRHIHTPKPNLSTPPATITAVVLEGASGELSICTTEGFYDGKTSNDASSPRRVLFVVP